jgi:hypothetical protein
MDIEEHRKYQYCGAAETRLGGRRHQLTPALRKETSRVLRRDVVGRGFVEDAKRVAPAPRLALAARYVADMGA